MLKIVALLLLVHSSLFAATTAERAKNIQKAGEDLSVAANREAVLKDMPKDIAEFQQMCQGESDCSELFERMLPEIMLHQEHVKAVINILVPLLPAVAYGADAPSYLQHQANEACQKDPKAFADALAKLKEPPLGKAIGFLNANMVKKNVPWFLDCQKSLNKAGLTVLAKRFEKAKR